MPKDLKLAELFVIITYIYCSSQGFVYPHSSKDYRLIEKSFTMDN